MNINKSANNLSGLSTALESRLIDCHYDRETSECSQKTGSKVGVKGCCYYKTSTMWSAYQVVDRVVDQVVDWLGPVMCEYLNCSFVYLLLLS